MNNENYKECQRESQFELLRILSMLLIVTGHCIAFGTTSEIPFQGLGSSISNIGNVGFFMLAGYFYKKRPLFQVFKKLYFPVWFWNLVGFSVIVVGSIFYHTNIEMINLYSFLTGGVWFLAAYFVIMVIAPPILKLIDRSSMPIWIVLMTVIALVAGNVVVIQNLYEIPIVETFIMGAYWLWVFILGYCLKKVITKKGKKSGILFSLVSLTFVVIVNVLNLVLMSYLNYYYGFILVRMWTVACIAGVILFAPFLRLKFSSNKINLVSQTCMGVYILHMGSYTFQDFIFHNQITVFLNQNNSFVMIFVWAIYGLIVYIILSALELLRIYVTRIIHAKMNK